MARAVAASARAIAAVVKDIGLALARTGAWIAGKLAAVWADWILPGLRAVVRAFEAVRDFFIDIFGPLLKWLEEQWLVLLELYDKYIKPILRVLDIASRVFFLLGKLGIKWAADLSQFLTKIRLEIEQKFYLIVGKVNEVISWINWLVDPRGLVRGEIFLSTLDRWLGGVWAVLVNRGITVDPGPMTSTLHARYPRKDPKATFLEFQSGATVRSEAVKLGLARLRQLGDELTR